MSIRTSIRFRTIKFSRYRFFIQKYDILGTNKYVDIALPKYKKNVLLSCSLCSSIRQKTKLAKSIMASPTFFFIKVWEVMSSIYENVRKKIVLLLQYRQDFIRHHIFSIYFRVHIPAPTPAPTPSQPCPISTVFSPQCIQSSAYVAFFPPVARKSMCGWAVYIGSRYSEYIVVVVGSIRAHRNTWPRGRLKLAPTPLCIAKTWHKPLLNFQLTPH